jgi:trk system potassium uptake protein TrkA
MRILIIGAGHAGFQLAVRLYEEKHSIVMVDTDADALAEAEAKLDIMTVVGPGSSPQTLQAAEIEKCQLVVAVTDCDEVNILACLYARSAGVTRNVARVANSYYINGDSTFSLEKMGVDLVINHKQECAREFVNTVQMPAAVEAFYLFDGQLMVAGFKIDADSVIVGRTPADFPNPELLEANRVIALHRNNKLIIPRGETVFEEDDTIYLVGKRGDISAFADTVCAKYKPYRKIIIAGGGDIGLMLAKMLEEQSVECVLLEKDEERAQLCSGELKKTLVLRADALAESTFDEAGLCENTAFVAVTGDDENNIMNCLMAKKKGAAFTATQIRRPEYTPVVDSLKLVNRVINPYTSMTHGIIHYLRRRDVQAASLLHNLSGELLDVVIEADNKVVGKMIQEIRIPKKSIVVTVLRGGKILPAVGNLELAEGDRLLIFAHYDAVKKLQSMFI